MRQRWSALEERLAALIDERERVLSAFLHAERQRIARCCHDMARAFARGGVLIPHGRGPAATDAAHVAVEFMHPVIVGKRALPALAVPAGPEVLVATRALPALAPTNDPTGLSTL